ncbi:MAG TPA: ATP-binding protein [Chryseosolibacter sp.]|nr:ATP-binding protein [Chryseosolibacter sp.]
MTLLQTACNLGVHFADTTSGRRSILLSNIVSVILFAVGMGLFGAYYVWYGLTVITLCIPAVSVLCLTPLLFNAAGYTTTSRILSCFIVPVTTISISLYSKNLYYAYQEELDYFTFRFIMLASCVFPAIFFTFRERVLLLSMSFLNLALLLSHDPLHTLFDVPYRQDNLLESNYTFTNIVVFITYMIMVGAVLFQKRISEVSEKRAEDLIDDLNDVNENLTEKNAEIEAQNSEIVAQTENLNISQQKLQAAYRLIQDQKEMLVKQNKTLSGELNEMNNDLAATNNELIKHNNELRQFSYTVSHNLRGPVASLSGLISLIDKRNLTDENASIFEHVKTSIQKLESIIKDLSKIIDIRHDIFSIRQQIDLKNEIEGILLEFEKDIKKYGIQISINVESCPVIYSVRPMIHSILYNLITNAIKYRSSDRVPEINVKAGVENDFVTLEVIDNGLGIDLKSHRENLFKLYKRFHFHTEGKGIGLYLVKLQAEALGGYVEVLSDKDRKTRFTAYIARPKNIDRQILFDESYANIFFDARINSTGVIWHGPISSEQYRHVFQKCLDFVKAYNTPNYIADLTDQGYIKRDDQLWMFKTILPQAAMYGLRRIAAIVPDHSDDVQQDYYNGIKHQLLQLGIEQQFFPTYDQAVTWLQESNETQIKFLSDDRSAYSVG